MMMARGPREVWITGIGLVSSLGEGLDTHWDRLTGSGSPAPSVDEAWFPPYPIHDLAPLDFARYIPKRSDQRQMETWQRIGVYAAGMALEDGSILGKPELLDRTNLNIAAGSGERDTSVDHTVLEKISGREGSTILANEILPGALKPTLFLAQLSNLLASNISIIHNVTGASRTFMGEEMAGISAVEDAFRRIAHHQGDLFLVGGALNARREDLLLNLELGRYLWPRPYAPVWQRRDERGGMVLGSAGAFLILEAREHAQARGARCHARIADMCSERTRRAPGAVSETVRKLIEDVAGNGDPLAVLSGASGAEPVLSEEREALEQLAASGRCVAARAYGSILGHMLEPHFPAGIALAALAISRGRFYPPFDWSGAEAVWDGAPENIVVTSVGHWRGEAAALVCVSGGS